MRPAQVDRAPLVQLLIGNPVQKSSRLMVNPQYRSGWAIELTPASTGLFDVGFRFSARVGTGARTSERLVSSVPIQAGKWSNIGLVLSKEGASIVVNGQTTTYPVPFVLNIQPFTRLTMGGMPNNHSGFFRGWLDSVRVSDGTRSVKEIAGAYRAATQSSPGTKP